jgi:peptidoglycan/LPS O-acetylase OafA/YrhL
LSEWLKSKELEIALPRWTFPASLAIYVVATTYFYAFHDGTIAVSVLFLTSILAANFGADLKPRAIMLLGNASYACYLLHTILIEYLRHKGVAIDGNVSLAIGILAGSWIIAITWHLSVEKLIAFVRRKPRLSGQRPSHMSVPVEAAPRPTAEAA